MSGGGGSGYIPRQPKRVFLCDTGVLRTELSSIDHEVLLKIKIGDILDVRLHDGKIVIEDNNGETLGSVIHENVQALIDCMAQGFKYKAIVIQKTQLTCQVKIQNEQL